MADKGLTTEQLDATDNSQLSKELEKATAELFNLRFQQTTGQLENPSRMKEIRKTIARIKTVITERELSEAK